MLKLERRNDGLNTVAQLLLQPTTSSCNALNRPIKYTQAEVSARILNLLLIHTIQPVAQQPDVVVFSSFFCMGSKYSCHCIASLSDLHII